MSSEVAKKEETKLSIANYMNKPAIEKQLEKLIGENKKMFISNVISLTNDNPQLKECDPNELYQVCIKSIGLNLPLAKELGIAYIVPYKNGKTGKIVPTFQIGKNGWRQLAERTGEYKYINAEIVREGEIMRNKFTMEISVIGDFPENKQIGYLALFEKHNGSRASVYMTNSQIEEYALRYVPSYKTDKQKGTKNSLWSDPIEKDKMALKTVLKRLIREYGTITTEMQKALNDEESDEKFQEYEDISNNSSRNIVEPIPENQPDPSKTPNRVNI